MMRKGIAAVMLSLMLSSLCTWAVADGAMFMDEATVKRLRERNLINEPEQKAAVFFSRGTEDLIISPSYEGASERFAWVVPVPSRPKVEILKGALFHELASLDRHPVLKAQTRGAGGLVYADGSVQLIERKTVGAYDVSVLSSSDGSALLKWLKSNRYHVPDRALEPIRGYVKDRWNFVACRVKTPKNAKGLRTGTLAPLRLTFRTRYPVYPMRLSAANPKPFTVLVYLIRPAEETGPGFFLAKRSWPETQSGASLQLADLRTDTKVYPTLSKLSSGKLRIFREWVGMRPEDSNRDYTWALAATNRPR